MKIIINDEFEESQRKKPEKFISSPKKFLKRKKYEKVKIVVEFLSI